ncbi:MAG: ferredoxin [Alphaproteobacteria bacterium]
MAPRHALEQQAPRQSEIPQRKVGRQLQTVQPKNVLSYDEYRNWTIAQSLMLLIGVTLIGLLLFLPQLGIHIMWNVIIPAAPAIVTLVPGIWRNICPMSTFSLLPRNFGLSFRMKLPNWLAASLTLISILALYGIVPLRHLSLNINGFTTAIMLAGAAGVALLLGILFEWRSAWCTTLCPIHPVERLYGFAPALSVKNARCTTCELCTAPCPDSMPSASVPTAGTVGFQRALADFLVGSFFGFVWGWYQVPDFHGQVGMNEILIAFAWPFGGALVSYVIYLAMKRSVSDSAEQQKLLLKMFATAAVSTYYWYRIPALVGFDPRSGQLYDLTFVLPDWFPMASQIITTAFFVWFLIIRNTSSGLTWQKRPAVAKRGKAAQAV